MSKKKYKPTLKELIAHSNELLENSRKSREFGQRIDKVFRSLFPIFAIAGFGLIMWIMFFVADAGSELSWGGITVVVVFAIVVWSILMAIFYAIAFGDTDWR